MSTEPMPESKQMLVKADSPTPPMILRLAVESGANVETLARLMELQERWEANEARKAFVKALAAFKTNPPRIEKSKEVTYKEVRYKYAPLDECAGIIGKALAEHGLSFRWDTRQVEGRISVTCVLQHEQGHSERVTLDGTPDNSGSKNSIQAIGSTVTYLERYTLLAITGLATANDDTDGITMGNASDFLANMEAASDIDELSRAYKEAITCGLKAQDPKAVELFMRARKKRERELQA